MIRAQLRFSPGISATSNGKAELHITNQENSCYRIFSRHRTSNCQPGMQQCDGGLLQDLRSRVFTSQTSKALSQEHTASNRSSGLSALLVRHTARLQGSPQQYIATEAIAPCGTAQGPPGLSTFGNTQTATGCLQPARMIARAPHKGDVAADPTKWRRKGPESCRSFACSRSATNGEVITLGLSAAIFTPTAEERGDTNSCTALLSTHSSSDSCGVGGQLMLSCYPHISSAEEGRRQQALCRGLSSKCDYCCYALAVIYHLGPYRRNGDVKTVPMP